MAFRAIWMPSYLVILARVNPNMEIAMMLSILDVPFESKQALIEVGACGSFCEECCKELYVRVCKSAAGYYIGYWCDTDGPVDRLSDYISTEEEANSALKRGMWVPRIY